MHYNHALVHLYSHATYPSTPPDDFHRMNCLAECLQATREYLATVLSQPAEWAIFRPFMYTAQLVAVLVAVSKLLLVRAQSWDTAEIWRSQSFSYILAQLVELLEQADEVSRQRIDGQGDGDGVFAKCAAKIRFIRAWFDVRVAPGASSDCTTVAGAEAENMEFQSDFAFQWQDGQFWLGLQGNDAWDIDY